jgi:hypothetical protein
MAGSFAIVGIIVLLGLLVQKELSTSVESSRARWFGKALNIGIVPQLIAFVMVVAFKILEVLQ